MRRRCCVRRALRCEPDLAARAAGAARISISRPDLHTRSCTFAESANAEKKRNETYCAPLLASTRG